MEATVKITTGSEKQIAWASEIASKWLAKLDQYIEDQIGRNDDLLRGYIEALKNARQTMVAGFAKVTAKQIIDIYMSKVDLAEAVIAKAKKQ